MSIQRFNYRGRTILEVKRLDEADYEISVSGPFSWRGVTPGDARDHACANLQRAIDWLMELNFAQDTPAGR